MKQKLVKLLYVASACLSLQYLVACGGSSGGSKNPAPAVAPYYVNNGSCITSANGQPVPMNYCSNLGGGNNGGYYMGPNGTCLSPNGQPAAPTYCTQNGGAYGNQYGGGPYGNQYGGGAYGNQYGGGAYGNQYGGAGYVGTNGYPGYGTGGYGTGGYGTGGYGNLGFGNGSAYGGGSQCIGTFYYYGNGSQQMINCDGYNCRGLPLYTTTGQQVFCQ